MLRSFAQARVLREEAAAREERRRRLRWRLWSRRLTGAMQAVCGVAMILLPLLLLLRREKLLPRAEPPRLPARDVVELPLTFDQIVWEASMSCKPAVSGRT